MTGSELVMQEDGRASPSVPMVPLDRLNKKVWHTSNDSGATWTRHSDTNVSGVQVLMSTNGQQIVIINDSASTYTSSDGGSSWTRTTAPWPAAAPSPNASTQQAVMSTTGDTIIVSSVKGYDTARLFVSTDTGATWAERSSSSQKNGRVSQRMQTSQSSLP